MGLWLTPSPCFSLPHFSHTATLHSWLTAFLAQSLCTFSSLWLALSFLCALPPSSEDRSFNLSARVSLPQRILPWPPNQASPCAHAPCERIPSVPSTLTSVCHFMLTGGVTDWCLPLPLDCEARRVGNTFVFPTVAPAVSATVPGLWWAPSICWMNESAIFCISSERVAGLAWRVLLKKL